MERWRGSVGGRGGAWGWSRGDWAHLPPRLGDIWPGFCGMRSGDAANRGYAERREKETVGEFLPDDEQIGLCVCVFV